MRSSNFTFDPSGSVLLVADRASDVVHSYAVETDGALRHLGDTEVQPAFVTFAELRG